MFTFTAYNKCIGPSRTSRYLPRNGLVQRNLWAEEHHWTFTLVQALPGNSTNVPYYSQNCNVHVPMLHLVCCPHASDIPSPFHCITSLSRDGCEKPTFFLLWQRCTPLHNLDSRRHVPSQPRFMYNLATYSADSGLHTTWKKNVFLRQNEDSK